jgi:hypothetical protein
MHFLATHVILADATDTTSSLDPLGPFSAALYNLGGFGLMVVLMLIGRLVVKSSVDEIKGDRDAWKKAWEVERDARIALQEQVQTGVEAGKLTNKLLEDLKTSAQGRLSP